MGLVSSGMIFGAFWDGDLAAWPRLSVIGYSVPTLGGGSGDYSDDGGVVGVGMGGCITSGGTSMLNISSSCFNAAIYLFTSCVSGIVGVGLRRSWVSSNTTCVS